MIYKYILITIAFIFTACSENPSAPSELNQKCIHKFQATEALVITSDSTYTIGDKEYIAPPEGYVEMYSRSIFMQKIETCYNNGLIIKEEMTEQEISEHTLNLCISTDDEVASALTGYKLPKPIKVKYIGSNCTE